MSSAFSIVQSSGRANHEIARRCFKPRETATFPLACKTGVILLRFAGERGARVTHGWTRTLFFLVSNPWHVTRSARSPRAPLRSLESTAGYVSPLSLCPWHASIKQVHDCVTNVLKHRNNKPANEYGYGNKNSGRNTISCYIYKSSCCLVNKTPSFYNKLKQ